VLAETLGYTLWWGSPAGMFVWVMAGWGVARTLARAGLPEWRAPAVASVAGVVALAGASAAVALAERPDYHLSEYRPLAAVYAGLKRGIPPRRTVLLIGALGNQTFRFKMASRYALLRRGIRPLSPGKDVRLGSWYEQDHRRYDCVVYVKDGVTRPSHSASLLTSTSFDDGTARFPVTVWSAPAGCPRR
jgi:hypothetical protein